MPSEDHSGDEQRSDLKILIVAPNASTTFGGEALLPVKYFHLLLQQGHSVRLLTHVRNLEDLQHNLSAHVHRVDFVADTVWHRLIWRIGRLLPGRIDEILLDPVLTLVHEHYQARHIRRLVAAGEVELIHQPAPVSPRAPSRLRGFGVPVVIGPMNGGMAFPPGYQDRQGRLARALVRTGRAVSYLANRVAPGKRYADALLVANERTRSALPFPEHPRVVMMPENGVDLAIWRKPEDRPLRSPGQALRLVYIGRLVDWKAVDITLEALARSRAQGVPIELVVVGDGPERARLEARAARPDLAGAVEFRGFLPQADCATILGRADALILNSVFECGGAVVLEAMAMGLPVIASEWGGPADYIDETCGLLVSPVPKQDFATRLAEAMMRLAADPELCARMGEAGAMKVRREYDWDQKIDRILRIYAEVARR